MDKWINIENRKPSPKDSPILAIESFEYFSIRALNYIDGWDGKGWYDASKEYGMGLEKDEAHYHEYAGMKFWMPLPPVEVLSILAFRIS